MNYIRKIFNSLIGSYKKYPIDDMNEIESPQTDKTLELMKTLSYDLAGDIVNLVLPSTKLNIEDIDMFEPIILGMFLVGYAYYSENSISLSKEEKGEQLKDFHQEMHNSIINEICIGVYKINNIEEIYKFSDNFAIILDKRFLNYFSIISQDKNKDYVELSKSVAINCFREKLSNDKLENFVSNLNITIALHLGRMSEKLKDF
jgi:hypothetical protein